MDLGEPGVDAFEGLRIVEVEDQHDSDRIFVVGSGDGAEGLLSGLTNSIGTVSQICTLMVLPPTTIFLVANSTPIVGLLSEA